MENWIWEVGFSKKIMQETAKKLKNCQVFVAKKLIDRDKREVMNWNLLSRWYDGLSKNSFEWMESWRLSWLYGNPKCWKVNFRIEVTMLCIKEVEIAHRLTDLLHRGRLLGSLILSTAMCLILWLRQLWRIFSIRSQISPKKLSVEEHRAQKDDRFLRGTQIACTIYEYFRATGTYEGSRARTLNSVRCKFKEWWCSRILRQMGSCFIICEWHALRYDPGRMVQVKDFRLWCHCTIKKRPEPRSRTITNWRHLLNVILITWWEIGTSESGAMLGNEDQSPRVKKGKRVCVGRKVGEWKHMDNVPKEIHVVSVITSKPRLKNNVCYWRQETSEMNYISTNTFFSRWIEVFTFLKTTKSWSKG